MREIKFRYWCRYECEMYPKAYMEEHMDLAFMSELLEAAQKRYILMQYTGLNDRKGKEVYEGDIIQIECDCDPGDYAVCNHAPSKGYVVWFQETASYEMRYVNGKLADEPFEDYMQDAYEVIGNIYEHPELLEG